MSWRFQLVGFLFTSLDPGFYATLKAWLNERKIHPSPPEKATFKGSHNGNGRIKMNRPPPVSAQESTRNPAILKRIQL